MKLCIAGTSAYKRLAETIKTSKYILESFAYFAEWQIPLIKHSDLFLLDSGAFTFQRQKNIDSKLINDYIEKYIKFIIDFDIEYFFEMDIDNIVGYDKVLEYRKIIERETGKKCMPVWQQSRGRKIFEEMCEEYDYASVGGMVNGSRGRATMIKEMYALNKLAAKHGCKLHGLGQTYNNCERSGFYSVDSTTWLSAVKYKNIRVFKNRGIYTAKNIPETRIKKEKVIDLAEYGLKQYILYQEYLDKF